jgi:thiamine kinase-like enzyme
LSFLPKLDHLYTEKLKNRPVILDESLSEGRIRDMLESVWPLPRVNQAALLHGDFWPGNILWKNGRLTAVIDWEDAALGDPVADFANSRLEILWAYGRKAMMILPPAINRSCPRQISGTFLIGICLPH